MEYKENPTTQKKSTPLPVLSEIELEILGHIKTGKTSAEIAIIRDCSVRTIEKHRSNIIKKMGMKSSQNALLVWIMKNLTQFDK